MQTHPGARPCLRDQRFQRDVSQLCQDLDPIPPTLSAPVPVKVTLPHGPDLDLLLRNSQREQTRSEDLGEDHARPVRRGAFYDRNKDMLGSEKGCENDERGDDVGLRERSWGGSGSVLDMGVGRSGLLLTKTGAALSRLEVR